MWFSVFFVKFKLIDVDAATDIITWRPIGSFCHAFAKISGLQLQSYKSYRGLLRATSLAGLTSDKVSVTATVEEYAPKLLGTILFLIFYAVKWYAPFYISQCKTWTHCFVPRFYSSSSSH